MNVHIKIIEQHWRRKKPTNSYCSLDTDYLIGSCVGSENLICYYRDKLVVLLKGNDCIVVSIGPNYIYWMVSFTSFFFVVGWFAVIYTKVRSLFFFLLLLIRRLITTSHSFSIFNSYILQLLAWGGVCFAVWLPCELKVINTFM